MRFVVLHHTGWAGHPDHYDLMIQISEGISDADAVLKTWASVKDEFPDGLGGTILTPRRDHRRAFLEFEGELSGARGHVVRKDSGSVTILKDCEDAGSQEWALELHGTTLSGVYRLRRIAEKHYKFEKTT